MPQGNRKFWADQVMACKAARERQERTQELLAPLSPTFGQWTKLDLSQLKDWNISEGTVK